MKTILPDKVYNVLKWIALTAIPTFVWALGILLPLYGVSAETANVVIVTVGVVGSVIGALIGVSTISYNKVKNGDTE